MEQLQQQKLLNILKTMIRILNKNIIILLYQNTITKFWDYISLL